jgi:peptide/nickel transport system ATP-binding protein
MSAVAAAPDRTLDVQGLSKNFPVPGAKLLRRQMLRAVDDVTFTLKQGHVTALVGESGSGKSTVARLISRLYIPTGGSILYRGEDVGAMHGKQELLRYRSRVQMIFQDPFSSLNPAKRVEYHVARPLLIHKIVPKRDVSDRVNELLDSVGLVPAGEIAKKYPHELSGGQRQRVAIARALAVEPEVILADEPTSMLDVSIRLGILNLILDLKRDRNIAFLYVTHDLASARYVADDVLVMYAGQIVEHGPTDDVLQRPMHPYTKLLLSAVPNPDAGLHSHRLAARPKTDLAVDLVGCRFAERCPIAVASCVTDPPQLLELRPGHFVRCPITDPSI